jgi:hypothetical protein
VQMRNQFLDREITVLTQKASDAKISDTERADLLREQQKLREMKRSPLSQLQN